MIKSKIIDSFGRNNSVEVTNNNALKVTTLDYYNYNNEIRFFTNPIYGVNMNVDGSSAVGEVIHDGGDTSAWTGSTINGTSLDFSSTNNPNNGIYNIEAISLIIDTVFQLKRSSSVNLTNYVSLSGWINLTAMGHPNAELFVYGYDTIADSIVGSSIDLYDYINTGNTGVYQTFTIPLSDMSLTTQSIDSFRFAVSNKGGATFDLDDLTLNVITSGGGPQIFTLQPNKGEILIIDSYNWFFVDDYDGVTGTNGIQKIEYDKILGETLQNGILYQRISNGETLFTITVNHMADFLALPNAIIRNYSSDGTNTLINVHYSPSAPFVLSSQEDKMILIINDNLTGLVMYRSSANCRSVTNITGSDVNDNIESNSLKVLSYGS